MQRRIEDIRKKFECFKDMKHLHFRAELVLGNETIDTIEYLLKIAECAEEHSYACIKLYSSNPDDLDFNNAEQTLFDLRKALGGGDNG